MKFILSYVNLPNDVTIDLNLEFLSFEAVESWVNAIYPTFTSYQIIVRAE